MSAEARLRGAAAGLALALGLALPAGAAQQWGLVVGINDYAAFGPWQPGLAPGVTYDLLGARNDAERIAQTLRATGVDLPDSRVLLDGAATEAAFLEAFEAMKAQASPGDTLIVTFAGHGAQEIERSAPFDEEDGRDEIIMFHDFDPDRPGTGRLTDDELQTLLLDAAGFEVVWVMDSCHSGGLERSLAFTLSRFGGLFEGLDDPSLRDLPVSRGDGSIDPEVDLAHVTQILATSSEALLVNEVQIEGQMHGALSWFFARAMSGEADYDGDGQLSRSELATYLDTRVFAHMNQSQQPRILPRSAGAGRPVITLATADDAAPVPGTGGGAGTAAGPQAEAAAPASGAPARPGGATDPGLAATGGPAQDRPPQSGTPTTAAAADTRLSVHVIGAAPPGLDPVEIRRVEAGAALTFEDLGDGRWQVYNRTGDRITTLDTDPERGRREGYRLPATAATLVRRTQVIEALKDLHDPTLTPLRVASLHGNGLMRLGEIIGFEFMPPAGAPPYMTLFNIASDGALQPLFPPPGDSGIVGASGLTQRFRVVAPTGVDTLFAVACPEVPEDLRGLMRAAAEGTPATMTLIGTIRGRGCQVGSLGLYTEG